jgi:hypothetical protein
VTGLIELVSSVVVAAEEGLVAVGEHAGEYPLNGP